MSEYFKPAPVLELSTIETVRRELTGDLRERCTDKYRIRSQWIIDLINEICARENRSHAYNAEVKKLAEQRMGMRPQNDAYYAREGDNLSLLIYNAQAYRRSEDLVQRGFTEGSNEILQNAFETGAKLLTPTGTILTVRDVPGYGLAPFEPRKRRVAKMIHGYPVKLLPKGAKNTDKPDDPLFKVIVNVVE